ncbi:MAG: hypothetical protein ACLP50_31650 [Solirubrobacteraceae bacterium]
MLYDYASERDQHDLLQPVVDIAYAYDVPLEDVSGEQTAQRIEDERWLGDVGARRWVVVMKDDDRSAGP